MTAAKLLDFDSLLEFKTPGPAALPLEGGWFRQAVSDKVRSGTFYLLEQLRNR